MTRNLTYLLGMIITILAGIYFFQSCCDICGAQSDEANTEKAEEEIVPPKEPEATSYPFSFKNRDYTYNVQDNFNFNISSDSILTPLSSKVETGITSLKEYLAANSDKKINITGLYRADETNASAFPNLGLARANKVKNYLVSQGIASSQTNTFGELTDNLVPLDGTFLGPVKYDIITKAEDADDALKALYDDIKANPLVLYFNTGEAAINLTPSQREKIAKIARYLDQVDGAESNVIGHTDGTGSRATNIRLGQERANFAKAYLVRNAIPEAKINSSSQGPDDPIASNATEEGRSKNRRTVVTLK